MQSSQVEQTPGRLARSWQIGLILGAGTLILGILVALNPTGSTTLIAVLLGVLLVVSGIWHVIRAFDADESHRAWLGIAGVLFVVAGAVLLAHLTFTKAVIALFIGIAWIVQGVVALWAGTARDSRQGRAWWIAFGVISIIAGIVVVTAPLATLTTLAILFGIWFIVMGVFEIAGALILRHGARHAAPVVLALPYARFVTRTGRLAAVLALNLALVAGLVTAGAVAHSVGVLAAGGDYLADAAAIGLSLLAIRLGRRPPSARRPQGFPRATAYAALANAALLLAVTLMVAVAAASRLIGGAGQVRGLPVLLAAGVAAVAMLAAGLILGGDEADADDSDGDRANVAAVLLDTLGDAAAAAGVAAAGALILLDPRLSWLDPAVALAIAAVIGYHAVKLTAEVIRTLRRPTPRTAVRQP